MDATAREDFKRNYGVVRTARDERREDEKRQVGGFSLRRLLASALGKAEAGRR